MPVVTWGVRKRNDKEKRENTKFAVNEKFNHTILNASLLYES